EDSAAELKLAHTFEGHHLGIISVDIDPVGRTVASSALDSAIKVWDLEVGKLKSTIEAGPVDIWSLMYSPNGQVIASGSHNGKINLFSLESGKKEGSFDTRGKFT
ncbi:WD40 repeat domain-containing protein, partial [Salmonella sp. s51228]|uniref:WD40 repeat domain-containing protein n=1 Tax=Salmonella sp. s51228 TaxID=3159652 RepID=UPI0039803306